MEAASPPPRPLTRGAAQKDPAAGEGRTPRLIPTPLAPRASGRAGLRGTRPSQGPGPPSSWGQAATAYPALPDIWGQSLIHGRDVQVTGGDSARARRDGALTHPLETLISLWSLETREQPG